MGFKLSMGGTVFVSATVESFHFGIFDFEHSAAFHEIWS